MEVVDSVELTSPPPSVVELPVERTVVVEVGSSVVEVGWLVLAVVTVDNNSVVLLFDVLSPPPPPDPVV